MMPELAREEREYHRLFEGVRDAAGGLRLGYEAVTF